MRDTCEACGKRDANLAQQRADQLNAVLQEAGKQLYASATQPPPEGRPSAEPSATTEAPGGRVVDAEYADVKH
jgi:hypothetical protein